MLALLFEVTPKSDGYQRYLDIAATLRLALEKHDGFLFIDRYRSLSRSETILSHSLWRDEASLAAWRTFEPHHHAQVAGREQVFADYRLRIADVVFARTLQTADWRPTRPSSYNEPAARPPRHIVVATSSETPSGREPTERFESLNQPGEFLSLYEVDNFETGMLQIAALTDSILSGTASGSTSFRLCEVERDYGMFERREAPQYYRPIRR